MAQFRHLWQLGIIEFTARRHNGGWLMAAFIGCTEVFEETYYEGSIGSVKERSTEWVRDLSEELVIAANDFEIEV
jgi:hypothetical protein